MQEELCPKVEAPKSQPSILVAWRDFVVFDVAEAREKVTGFFKTGIFRDQVMLHRDVEDGGIS